MESAPGVEGYRDYVEAVALGLLIETSDSLELPAYDGRPALEYAEPL